MCLLTNLNCSEIPFGHNITKQNATLSCTALFPINLTFVDQDRFFFSIVFHAHSFGLIILKFTNLVTDFNTVWIFIWSSVSDWGWASNSSHSNNLPLKTHWFPVLSSPKCQVITLYAEIKIIYWVLDQDSKCNLCALLFRKEKILLFLSF